MKDEIRIGDRVDVYFGYTGGEFNIEVVYIPCATGDSWHLKRNDGTIIYVMIFDKMVKL